MSAAAVTLDYPSLLAKYPPKIIRSDAESEYFSAVLEQLDARSADLNPAEEDLADLLTLLIEDYEAKNYQLPKASPVEVVQFLMDQHSLRQIDMLDIFGSRSVVSEVLSGKRELSKEHIRRLVDRFSIPADMLL